LIANDSSGARNNKLVLYIIFEKDFTKEIQVKVFDKANLEFGRVRAVVSGKAGEAKYFDFVFDPRTYIEVKSKITLE